MARSYSLLKKRLIKESAVLCVAIMLLSAGGLFLQYRDEDAQSELRVAEGDVNQNRAKLGEVKLELASGEEQITYYNSYVKTHNSDLSLNREQATKWIAALREKYHLVNLTITIPPFTEVSKDTFPVKSGTLIKTDVKLGFNALTDNSIFAFIEKLQRELPGVVVISDVKVNRTAELSGNVILELNRHHITPLVSGELQFTWVGIRKDVKGAPANAK